MKAFIDREQSELITIGYNPELARLNVVALGLFGWAWVGDDRAIPAGWEEIELPIEVVPN
jgi:hypothetical protein